MVGLGGGDQLEMEMESGESGRRWRCCWCWFKPEGEGALGLLL